MTFVRMVLTKGRRRGRSGNHARSGRKDGRALGKERGLIIRPNPVKQIHSTKERAPSDRRKANKKIAEPPRIKNDYRSRATRELSEMFSNRMTCCEQKLFGRGGSGETIYKHRSGKQKKRVQNERGDYSIKKMKSLIIRNGEKEESS